MRSYYVLYFREAVDEDRYDEQVRHSQMVEYDETISLKKVKQEIEQNLQPIGHYKTAILCATIIKRLDRFDAKQ